MSLFTEVDSMLSGVSVEPMPAPQIPEPSDLFSTYLLSPSYYMETPELLAVKLVTAKGDPFYILDTKKNLKDQVCGITEVFLAPYDAATACADECEGYPALHLVPACIVGPLFKSLACRKEIVGLLFVSMVSMQFYYRQVGCDTEWTTIVYRVANDKEGNIEARETKDAQTCDYPVPYILVDETALDCSLVEKIGAMNVNLIDSLCRSEYAYLHEAEQYPDDLDDLLKTFMGNHSHKIKGMLDAQLDKTCDDAFLRRNRKKDIDTLVRLMMREIELVGEIKKNLEELALVNKAVGKCSAVRLSKSSAVNDDCEDPLLKPLLHLDTEKRSRAVISEEAIDKFSEMMAAPLEDEGEDDIGIENAELLASPSGSDCSR